MFPSILKPISLNTNIARMINFDKLNISIPYQQQVNVIIEFSLEIIGSYNGLDNLDKTWDDNIMPVINQSIIDSGIYIKKSNLEIMRKTNKEIFSYKLSLIANPPNINLNSLISDLTKRNLQKSLCISRVYESGNLEILYADIYNS